MLLESVSMMQILKEAYKKGFRQIVHKPQFSVSKNVQPSGRGLHLIEELISNSGSRQCILPVLSINYVESGLTRYLALMKNTVLDKHQENSQLVLKRNFYQGKPTEDKKPLPKLLYIQNPLVWISNKIDFRFLRYSWDSSFSEEEFTRGARQAISTVTQMLSRNMFESMKPLLTKNALLNLRRDVEILWADEVRRNIGLMPEDIQLIIPRKIYFRQSAEPKLLNQGTSPALVKYLTPKKAVPEKKFCDIDVLFIGMKWLEERTCNTPLVFVDIVSRFHRNYTEGITPDWTISAFKVRRFSLIPQKASS